MGSSDELADDEDVGIEDLRDLIEAQKEEHRLEQEKEKTRRLEIESQERQAEQALEAQLEDRERQREYQAEKNITDQRYGLGYFFMILVFFGFLVWQGNAEIVYEIIRVSLYGGIGWAAGQSYGKSKAQRQSASGNGESEM